MREGGRERGKQGKREGERVRGRQGKSYGGSHANAAQIVLKKPDLFFASFFPIPP